MVTMENVLQMCSVVIHLLTEGDCWTLTWTFPGMFSVYFPDKISLITMLKPVNNAADG